MAGRTVALVAAVVAVAAIGAGGGVVGGMLTQKQPAAAGSPTPLSEIPPQVQPTAPKVTAAPDPAYPPALEKVTDWVPAEVRGPTKALRVQIPADWNPKSPTVIKFDPIEAKFRLVREYNLRVQARPDMTSIAQTRDDRAAELRRNNTAGLKVISQDSGTVVSRSDKTTRRYEELYYSYIAVNEHNYRKYVRLRWIDGLELSVTGRERDAEALRPVLERATETAELDPT